MIRSCCVIIAPIAAAAWAVNRSSVGRQSVPEKHQRWRHRGSRSDGQLLPLVTAAATADRDASFVVECIKLQGPVAEAPWWQLELNDVREVPLVHVSSDFELAAGHLSPFFLRLALDRLRCRLFLLLFLSLSRLPPFP